MRWTKTKAFSVLLTSLFLGTLSACSGQRQSGQNIRKATAIEVNGTPEKTYYRQGETFDPSGLSFDLRLDDKSKVDVSSYQLSFSDLDFSGERPAVTISYSGDYGSLSTTYSADLVFNRVENLSLLDLPFKTNYRKGEAIRLQGINVMGTWTDGYRRPIPYTDLQFSPAVVESDTYEVRITYEGMSLSYPITHDALFDGFLLEGEDYFAHGTVPAGTENYIERVNEGSFLVNTDSTTASGGKYLASIDTGDEIAIHFHSSEARRAAVAVCLSNTNLNAGGATSSDLKLNKTIAVKFNGNNYSIGDDVLLKGTNSWSGSYQVSMFFMWQEISFGSMDVRQGDNTIDIKFIVDQVRTFDGQVAAPNFDYVKISYDNDGAPTEDYVTGLELDVAQGMDDLPRGTTLESLSKSVRALVTYHSGIVNPLSILTMDCSVDGKKIEDSRAAFEPGEHTITVENNGIRRSFGIKINDTIKFEAEDFYSSPEEVPAGTSQYGLRTAGSCKKMTDSSEASAGGYLGSIHYGDTVEYHVHSSTSGRTGQMAIRLANSDIDSDNVTIHEMKLSEALSLNVNGAAYAIPDTAVMSSHKVTAGENCWFIWTTVDIGSFTTKEGDNVIEMKFIPTKIRGIDSQVAAPNVDYIQVTF